MKILVTLPLLAFALTSAAADRQLGPAVLSGPTRPGVLPTVITNRAITNTVPALPNAPRGLNQPIVTPVAPPANVGTLPPGLDRAPAGLPGAPRGLDRAPAGLRDAPAGIPGTIPPIQPSAPLRPGTPVVPAAPALPAAPSPNIPSTPPPLR